MTNPNSKTRVALAGIALISCAALAIGPSLSGATSNDSHSISGSVEVGAVRLTVGGSPYNYTINGWGGIHAPGETVTSETIQTVNGGNLDGTVSGVVHINNGEHATVEVFDSVNGVWVAAVDGDGVPPFALAAGEQAGMKIRVTLDSDSEAGNVGVSLTLVITAA